MARRGSNQHCHDSAAYRSWSQQCRVGCCYRSSRRAAAQAHGRQARMVASRRAASCGPLPRAARCRCCSACATGCCCSWRARKERRRRCRRRAARAGPPRCGSWRGRGCRWWLCGAWGTAPCGSSRWRRAAARPRWRSATVPGLRGSPAAANASIRSLLRSEAPRTPLRFSSRSGQATSPPFRRATCRCSAPPRTAACSWWALTGRIGTSAV
mmetsp:Transcript_43336/g.108632  ORF Transcript_43336/g.108632 Transcript_43336/m.108632 type:complete len:212 (-) Transcript_43336:269-904(-)